MIDKFEVGKKYKFLPSNIKDSDTQHEVDSSNGMEKITTLRFVTCQHIGKNGEPSATHKHCYQIRFKELDDEYWWSIKDFKEYEEEDEEEEDEEEDEEEEVKMVSGFEAGKKYRYIFGAHIGSGGGDFDRDAEKVKSAGIVHCVSAEGNNAKFDVCSRGWYWERNAFEEVITMVDIKLEECSKANLAEAKKQFEMEKANAEITFAKQQLTAIQNRIDLLNREINYREEEKAKLLESLKVFK